MSTKTDARYSTEFSITWRSEPQIRGPIVERLCVKYQKEIRVLLPKIKTKRVFVKTFPKKKFKCLRVFGKVLIIFLKISSLNLSFDSIHYSLDYPFRTDIVFLGYVLTQFDYKYVSYDYNYVNNYYLSIIIWFMVPSKWLSLRCT